MKNRRKEKGSLTVEAALVLVIFIFGYVSITCIHDFIRVHMIVQYSIEQAAKDISSYCYIVSKTELMKDSGRLEQEADQAKADADEVIDSVAKLYEAISDGSANIRDSVDKIPENEDLLAILDSIKDTGEVTREEYNKILAAANTMVDVGGNYFSNPKGILKGLLSVAKSEGLSALKTYVVAVPISKALVSSQIELYGTDRNGQDVLKQLGVVDGISGLDFSGSTLFNDGETIEVRAAYTMKVELPFFDKKEFHFIQTASTRAWGAE